MISDTNTVFGGGTSKYSNLQEAGMEELQESARFGGIDDLNGQSMREEEIMYKSMSERKSDFFDGKEEGDSYLSKIKNNPDMKFGWLQFYTDLVYCCASSLLLTFDDLDYTVPFAVAKIVLASMPTLEQFVQSTVFHQDGSM